MEECPVETKNCPNLNENLNELRDLIDSFKEPKEEQLKALRICGCAHGHSSCELEESKENDYLNTLGTPV